MPIEDQINRNYKEKYDSAKNIESGEIYVGVSHAQSQNSSPNLIKSKNLQES